MKKLNKIPAIISIILLLPGVLAQSVSAINVDPDNKYKYDEIIIPAVMDLEQAEQLMLDITYSEVFEYFDSDATINEDKAIPGYVLIFLRSNLCTEVNFSTIIGDYVIRDVNTYSPNPMFYYVYTPSDGNIYTLKEAYDLKLTGIEEALPYCAYAERIGDVNYDKTINIKDSTLIQKHLANLATIKDDPIRDYFDSDSKVGYMSDFNRDGKRDIKDATAIQKYIAQIVR